MKVTYIERSPGTWRLRIETGRDENGVRKFSYETLQGTEDDAQRRRFELLTSNEQGTFAAPDKLTVRAYLDQWIANRLAVQNITRSTADTYSVLVRAYVAPDIGGLRVQKLRGGDVQALYTKLAATHALSTVHLVHAMLNRSMKDARRARLVTVNPMEEVVAPRRGKAKPKAITQDQAAALLTSIEGSWLWPIALIGFTAGMRRGELCGLKWSDMPAGCTSIRVERQLIERRDNVLELKAPKTEAGTRSVTLPAEAAAVLRQHRAAALQTRLAMGLGRDGFEDAFVFTSDGVRPIRPDTLTGAFTNECEKLGLKGSFTFHGTRHTHLTLLLAKVGKEGARMVQERAGHANLTTTLETYQRVFESDDAKLAGLAGGFVRERVK